MEMLHSLSSQAFFCRPYWTKSSAWPHIENSILLMTWLFHHVLAINYGLCVYMYTCKKKRGLLAFLYRRPLLLTTRLSKGFLMTVRVLAALGLSIHERPAIISVVYVMLLVRHEGLLQTRPDVVHRSKSMLMWGDCCYNKPSQIARR